MFKTITFNQLNMIGDKAYNSSDHIPLSQASDSSQFQQRTDPRGGFGFAMHEQKGFLLSAIRKFDKLMPVLPPKHGVKVVSDFMNNSAILLLFIVLSIALSFHVSIRTVFPVEGVYIALAILFANAILTLNTGFQRLGVLVVSRSVILATYLHTRFTTDVVSFLSIIVILLLD